MATQTASTRQPFAPLNHSRLQSLTNLKNRQNALLVPSTSTKTTKRKATTFESDSSSLDNNNNDENIDPILFFSPKRSCPSSSSSSSTYTKPSNYFLTRAAPPSPPTTFSSLLPTTKPTSSRKIMNPKSRTATPRIDARKIGASGNGATLSAPAGRSPTRKRIGILNNRRKTTSSSSSTPPFSRIEPPRFTLSNPRSSSIEGGLGFSIDAALSGTIPSYTSRSPPVLSKPETATASQQQGIEAIPLLHTPAAKESWFFAIHEDTAEELATNLMEHSTCTLDISSDEEGVVRERDCRGKENVAPVDDVSQTQTRSGSRVVGGEGEGNEMQIQMEEVKVRMKGREKREDDIEIDREPLGPLKARDFYAEGCEEGDVFVVVEEQEEDEEESYLAGDSSLPLENVQYDFPSASSSEKGKGIEIELEIDIGAREEEHKIIDELMSRDDVAAPRKAALLQPIEKAEEGWTLWESGSVDGE